MHVTQRDGNNAGENTAAADGQYVSIGTGVCIHNADLIRDLFLFCNSDQLIGHTFADDRRNTDIRTFTHEAAAIFRCIGGQCKGNVYRDCHIRCDTVCSSFTAVIAGLFLTGEQYSQSARQLGIFFF